MATLEPVKTNVRFCKKDHSLVYDPNILKCPTCGGKLTDSLSQEEIREFSRDAHGRDTDGYNKSQTAACFLVIGGIALIIGILFAFLSLQRKVNVIVGINYLSLQFFVCVIGCVSGVACLTIGLIKIILAHKERQIAERDIRVLSLLKEKPVG